MLTIYAPSNKPESKCWEVFNGIQANWTSKVKVADNTMPYYLNDDNDSMFWGLVNNNTNLIHQIEERGQTYWFTDTPYFGRFDNNNLRPDNHYWRLCKDNIHTTKVLDCDSDRFQKFKITTKDYNPGREYILICPSSAGVNAYLGHNNWLEETINVIKNHTDRPIKVRHKPRGRGTSGPAVADIPLADDLKNAHCCVTSCSISAIESLALGVPVICSARSFAAPIAETNLSNIEKPLYRDPTQWFNSLAYQQFTPEEYNNGTAISILKNFKILI
ncbi:MAG TPA: hypothetical protein DEG69_16005 [Flavobacteriaceae bacterium]|nr:hypothetical protein [Flavobacteriaceae bacterium]